MPTRTSYNKIFVSLAGLALIVLLAGCLGPGTGTTTAPKLAISEASLYFSADTDALTLHIENTGAGDLKWTVASDIDWMTATPVDGENAGTLTVSVERADLTAGEHTAMLTVKSNGGSASVRVTVMVADGFDTPPTGKVPAKVEMLDARGFTFPAGFVPMRGDVAASSSEAKRLIGLTESLSRLGGDDRISGTSAATVNATEAPLVGTAVPDGFHAAFVLSWNAVGEATDYRIFMDDGKGYEIVADVPVGELEDASEPTYMVRGEYNIGTVVSFVVQALNDGRAGSASDPDSATIIPPTSLNSPANGTSVTSGFQFHWEEHPEATGYVLYVVRGSQDDHVFYEVIDDESSFSSDEARVALTTGEYGWYVLTQGQMGMQGPDAYALSELWTFQLD